MNIREITNIHGLPVVNQKNLPAFLRARAVGNFRKLSPAMPIETYLKRKLTPRERRELHFVPKIEAIRFKDPRGRRFTGFRCACKNGALIFTLLPEDMLPICAEFRHGSEKVMLNLPAGLIEPNDANPKARAKKEFEEETGIALQKLIPLNARGIALDARILTRKNFFFLGVPKIPLAVRSQRTHDGEFVARCLVSLLDWMKFMEEGLVDDCSIAGTLLALRKLGKIHG